MNDSFFALFYLSGGVNAEARADYEQKIYKLQEELSDLLRSRSQVSQLLLRNYFFIYYFSDYFSRMLSRTSIYAIHSNKRRSFLQNAIQSTLVFRTLEFAQIWKFTAQFALYLFSIVQNFLLYFLFRAEFLFQRTKLNFKRRPASNWRARC